MIKNTNINYIRILLNNETHYIGKNNKTYCGIEIPKGMSGRNSIEIVTCNKCVNIYILNG